jgi:hypothetical protein
MWGNILTHIGVHHTHDVGDDASLMTSNEGNSASLTTAETSLHIVNGNDAIVTRATIAIATMVKMPAHQRQQCQLADMQQGRQHQ